MTKNEFILKKQMQHFGMWVWHKYNMQNTHGLITKYGDGNNRVLEKTRMFIDDKIFGRKVPHKIFQEGVSSRVTQVMDKDKQMFLIEQPSRFGELVLEALSDQKHSRHYTVLSFILEYYENAIAMEVPVWRMNMTQNITGHIDLLCYEHPFLWIHDYKPDAENTNACSQLVWYRKLLCELLKIDIRNVKIGWFDEYKEFLIEEPIIELELA